MIDINIEALKTLVRDSTEETMDAWHSNYIKVPFDFNPKDFLAFAKCDLSCEYSHSLINALSNIKRAIDCQLDSLLYGFGLLQISRAKRWDFPYKSKVLTKIGVISPRILRKINQKRNLLEHEYTKPEAGQVEDAFDVANLFILYTDKFISNALLECDLFDKDRNDLSAKLLYEQNKIILSCREWENKGDVTHKVLKEVNASSEEYLDYLSWFISLYTLRG